MFYSTAKYEGIEAEQKQTFFNTKTNFFEARKPRNIRIEQKQARENNWSYIPRTEKCQNS